jgi:hypothetical protein
MSIGLCGAVYCICWATNYRGWTTSLLERLYNRFGRIIWPGGTEDSYVLLMRLSGWFVAIVFLAMLGAGVAELVHGGR